MTKIETVEQARVWLHTYEVALKGANTVEGACRHADDAVTQWRARVGAVEKRPPEEADLLREQRDKARALLDDVRIALKAHNVADEELPAVVQGLMEANEAAWQEVREARGRLAEVGDALAGVSPEFSPACDIAKQVKAVVSERNSLQEDLTALKERLRALEKEQTAAEAECSVFTPQGTLVERVRWMRERIADANAQLVNDANVRIALGAHNKPERSVAECVGALVQSVQTAEECKKWDAYNASLRAK